MLTIDDVTKIGKLAKIKVDTHEKENLLHQLNGILSWFDKLQEVDVTSVDLLSDAVNAEEVAMHERHDIEPRGNEQRDNKEFLRDIFSNSPCKISNIDDMFFVPKVIE
jgi:aspartyl-tRNA(Asn)/glutamyl-tRNA(Gln) amidotransferase subunit C